MRVSKVPKRNLIYSMVRSDIRWAVFKKKTHRLKERMEEWLPQLAAGHGRDG